MNTEQWYMDQAASLIPSADSVEPAILSAIRATGYMDAQLAPILIEKLRHAYTKVQEQKYPMLAAWEGKVLPIDRSIDPSASTWEDYIVDHVGYADFIDSMSDDLPTSTVVGRKITGELRALGHAWMTDIFELEKVAKGGPMSEYVSRWQERARFYHARTTNWVWLFGDSARGMLGLCNHPNIQVGLAPAAAASGNSRKWEDGDKTDNEVCADVAVGINGVWNTTLGTYQCGKVLMGPRQWQYLSDTRPTGDRYASLLDLLMERYKGDPRSGQGEVEFGMLNECQAEYRRDPRVVQGVADGLGAAGTGTDSSGITGDFLMFVPKLNSTDDAHFIQSRRYSQLPPEARGFKIENYTHSKIGGCRLRVPTAFYRLDFGA